MRFFAGSAGGGKSSCWTPIDRLSKTRVAWAPAIVAPSVLEMVFRIRIALIASSMRLRLSSSLPQQLSRFYKFFGFCGWLGLN